jgi:hypothetical protein
MTPPHPLRIVVIAPDSLAPDLQDDEEVALAERIAELECVVASIAASPA